ncbi:MAG: LysE family transporter [Bacteroidales bacterium]|jgi:threonine/homoserine/homoserine lactone efflux protein
MIPAIEILLKGIILGLAVSMPPGPIGIVLINRTIKRGLLSGFFSGLGLASADTLLAVLAGLGFTVVISFIKEARFIITIIAGLTIIGVGLKVFLSNPVKEFRNREKANKSLWRDFYSVFVLSIYNPYTIFIFVAFFSGVHINGNVRPELVPFFLIPGVFLGALAWWFFLSYFVSRFKEKIRLRIIVRINKIAGIVILVIGVIVLLSVFTPLKL